MPMKTIPRFLRVNGCYPKHVFDDDRRFKINNYTNNWSSFARQKIDSCGIITSLWLKIVEKVSNILKSYRIIERFSSSFIDCSATHARYCYKIIDSSDH